MDNNIDLKCTSYIGLNLDIGQYRRFLEIKNMGNRTYDNVKVYLLEDTFHRRSFVQVGRLASGVTRSLNMTCDVRGGVTSKDIPPLFKCEVVDGNDQVIFRENYRFAMNAFRDVFQQRKYTPRKVDGKDLPRYNIFVFGLAGSGKTSLVNSWITLLHNEAKVVNPLERGGNDHHVTKKLQYHSMDHMIALADGREPATSEEREKFRFAVVDAWGLTADNYDQFTLESMIEGHLPSNWDMGNNYAEHFDTLNSSNAVSTRYKRCMHAVVFVIPCQSVANDNFLNQCRQYFIRLQSSCGNAVIVLARADSIDPNVRNDPNQDANVSVDLKKVKEKVANRFNVEQGRIFFGVNYTTETTKSFNIDKNNFRILERALDQASFSPAIPSNDFIF